MISLASFGIVGRFIVRPRRFGRPFLSNRCCKVRVESGRKQENGIYSRFMQSVNLQLIMKIASLQAGVA